MTEDKNRANYRLTPKALGNIAKAAIDLGLRHPNRFLELVSDNIEEITALLREKNAKRPTTKTPDPTATSPQTDREGEGVSGTGGSG